MKDKYSLIAILFLSACSCTCGHSAKSFSGSFSQSASASHSSSFSSSSSGSFSGAVDGDVGLDSLKALAGSQSGAFAGGNAGASHGASSVLAGAGSFAGSAAQSGAIAGSGAQSGAIAGSGAQSGSYTGLLANSGAGVISDKTAIDGSLAGAGAAESSSDVKSAYGDKKCCTGPFPGPKGSIHDSIPASSVAGSGVGIVGSQTGSGAYNTGITGGTGSYGGSAASSGSQTAVGSGSVPSNGYNTGLATGGSGSYGGSGANSGSQTVVSSGSVPGNGYNTGLATGGSGSYGGQVTSGSGSVAGSGSYGGQVTSAPGIVGSGAVYVPTGAQKTPGKCCTGPFPGPTGSIYESKPASSVQNKFTTDHSYTQTNTQTNTQTTNFGGSLTTKLPGPSGSIYDSKPSVGSNYNTGTTVNNQIGGGITSRPKLPGPSGNIYDSKPAIGFSYNTGTTVSNQIGSGGSAATVPAHIYDQTSTSNQFTQSNDISGTTEVIKKNDYVSGNVLVDKTTNSYTDSVNSGYTGSNAGSGAVTGQTHFTSAPYYTSPVAHVPNSGSGAYHTGTIPHGTATTTGTVSGTQSSTNTGFATGNVLIQKPNNQLIDKTNSGSNTGIYQTNYKPTYPVPTTGSIGGSLSNAQSGSGSGYATGNVLVQKPDNVVVDKTYTGSNDGTYQTTGSNQANCGSSGCYTPAYSTPTTTHVAGVTSGSLTNTQSTSDSGYATGNVIVQKPGPVVDTSGSYRPNYASPQTPNLDGSVSGAVSNAQSGSNTGFATGNVLIQKPGGELVDRTHSGSLAGSQQSTGSGSISNGQSIGVNGNTAYHTPSSTSYTNPSNNAGYATGGVIVEKPADVSSSGSEALSGSLVGGVGSSTGALASSGALGSGSGSLANSGAFAVSGSSAGSYHTPSYGSQTAGSSGFATGDVQIQKTGSAGQLNHYGQHSGCSLCANGGQSGSGSFAASHSGAVGLDGLVNPANLLHGILGGNSFGGSYSKAGSFSKSGAFGGAGSFASASASASSGHY